jgi:predicted metal-dependent hydrolase
VPDRALPDAAFLPGDGEPPRRARGEGETPPLEAPRWREHRGYLWGCDLFEHGFPWEAHEEWEAAWAATPPGLEHALLAGLIQAAAAVVQARLGKWRGVTTLAQRARHNLLAAGGPRLCGVDVAGFARELVGWAARVAAAKAWEPPPSLGIDAT